jgi:hypothetical protein
LLVVLEVEKGKEQETLVVQVVVVDMDLVLVEVELLVKDLLVEQQRAYSLEVEVVQEQ